MPRAPPGDGGGLRTAPGQTPATPGPTVRSRRAGLLSQIAAIEPARLVVENLEHPVDHGIRLTSQPRRLRKPQGISKSLHIAYTKSTP
jgi:hypothetical protein